MGFKRKGTETSVALPSVKKTTNIGEDQKQKIKKIKIENHARKESLRKTTLSAPNYHIPSISRNQYNMATVKPLHGYKKLLKKKKESTSMENNKIDIDPTYMSQTVYPKNVFDFKFVERFEGKEPGYGKLVESMVALFGGKKRRIVGKRVLPNNKVQYLTEGPYM